MLHALHCPSIICGNDFCVEIYPDEQGMALWVAMELFESQPVLQVFPSPTLPKIAAIIKDILQVSKQQETNSHYRRWFILLTLVCKLTHGLKHLTCT